MYTLYGWVRWALVIVVSVSFVACADDGAAPEDEIVDGKDESAFTGGKADELLGPCERQHILLLVNDPKSGADRLAEAGLHRRAANHIEAHRAGPDEHLDTADDVYFRSVEDIDAVYFVGPVAMDQLTGAVAAYCQGSGQDGAWRAADTVFSPRPYHDSHIGRAVDMIDSAERSIDMAMYSLSDNRAFSALGEAVDRGVRVRLLFESANGDHLDTAGSRSARLEDLGVDVRYINRIMHHKFAIIDGPQDELLQASEARFFSGSANLSYGAATRYDENITFHRADPALVLTMQREFNHLWEHSRDLEWNDELSYFETLPIHEDMIPAANDLEVLLTSPNFETTQSTRWGPGFRTIDYSEVVADRLVELIEDADSSIWVAAGFLRSRPVSEALLRRWQEEPDLDIRIYLDQSEYISQWYNQSQQGELDDCLEAAGGEREEEYDCLQKGYVFSFELLDEGIPVRFKNYSYRWHYTYALQMHHKYMIFDRETVATGSYNFSNNAEQNTMENVIVYRKPVYGGVVDGFVANFETIWETGRAEGVYEDLIDHVETSDVIDIVFDEPAALTWQEVTDLRRLIRERCPDVNSEPYRTRPEDHRTCTVQ